MKKLSLFITSIIISYSTPTYAQGDGAQLTLQSPDGKTVKLLWFVQSWKPGMTGFDLKRREGVAAWEKLNTEPIAPGISTKKKLALVEADKTEESRVRDKMYDLIKEKKLQEAGAEYTVRLASDELFLREETKTMSHDYDIALLNGFAYIDHTAAKRATYQYGLFMAGTDKMLATADWNHGEIPDLDVISEITTRSNPGKKGIQVTWNADLNKMRANDVNGFNIYRQGIRLNETPIVAGNNKDLSEYTWNDRGAASTDMTQYSISAESIFGIEGKIRSYNYDPADHPKEYRKAEVTEITSLGYYFKEGISVQWTFPKEAERFIKGFYVEKDNIPEGFKQVSRLQPVTARSFIDNTASPVSTYIRFRVVAVYNDRTMAPGTERVYSYFPQREPPKPMNARLRIVNEDKKLSVQMNWDGPMRGDSTTAFYRVYMLDPVVSKLNLVADNIPVKSPGYKYAVPRSMAGNLQFAVVSVGKFKTESNIDDTLSAWIPSVDLPVPALTVQAEESGTVSLQWQYPDVGDLKGFRISRDGTVIATETEVKKDTRQYKVTGLQAGTYKFEVRAVSETGMTSDAGTATNVQVGKTKK